MRSEDINDEIIELKMIKDSWARTSLNNSQANDLISKIGSFNHTFAVEFPNASKHFQENKYAEIHIADGVSELKHYAKSNLKQKDDVYFYSGMKNIKKGIVYMISNLEKELE